MRRIAAAAILCALGCLTPAHATVIDFETQAAGRGGSFTGTVDSPLGIGIATFTGGELLKNESGSTDLTGLYASTNFVSGAYLNPITIHFSSGISGFSVLITNLIGDFYTVADDRGGSTSANISGSQVFSLAETGITSVTITSAATKPFPGAWDFAIDNVTFTAGTASVPEPGSVVLMLSVLGALMVARRRSA